MIKLFWATNLILFVRSEKQSKPNILESHTKILFECLNESTEELEKQSVFFDNIQLLDAMKT